MRDSDFFHENISKHEKLEFFKIWIVSAQRAWAYSFLHLKILCISGRDGLTYLFAAWLLQCFEKLDIFSHRSRKLVYFTGFQDLWWHRFCLVICLVTKSTKYNFFQRSSSIVDCNVSFETWLVELSGPCWCVHLSVPICYCSKGCTCFSRITWRCTTYRIDFDHFSDEKEDFGCQLQPKVMWVGKRMRPCDRNYQLPRETGQTPHSFVLFYGEGVLRSLSEQEEKRIYSKFFSCQGSSRCFRYLQSTYKANFNTCTQFSSNFDTSSFSMF